MSPHLHLLPENTTLVSSTESSTFETNLVFTLKKVDKVLGLLGLELLMVALYSHAVNMCQVLSANRVAWVMEAASAIQRALVEIDHDKSRNV